MSTAGRPFHKRGTFSVANEDSSNTSRARRDHQYRAALGLSGGEPIPSNLGSATGHGSHINRAMRARSWG